ncbi:MAG: iron-containing redox enzyme family protein, partial [Actinobacteria bacterium]|nr:iron-containing redox enzyme family protein [Actinomycetota bacterium]
SGEDIVAQLDELATPGDGASLSEWLVDHGEATHVREFCAHRTAWQLKEADPHTWVIPRLYGAAKAALVHIQADEYGEGVEEDVHAELFALTLRELGMDDTYGASLDLLPGHTLAGTNVVSLFGLHRRLRGAAVGHLAIFEMFSVLPMGRVSDVLGRLGASTWARLFFDTHVVADADHQTIAARDLAGGLVEQDPRLAVDILFGAHAIGSVEAEMSRRTIVAWEAGRTSLRRALPEASQDPLS